MNNTILDGKKVTGYYLNDKNLFVSGTVIKSFDDGDLGLESGVFCHMVELDETINVRNFPRKRIVLESNEILTVDGK